MKDFLKISGITGFHRGLWRPIYTWGIWYIHTPCGELPRPQPWVTMLHITWLQIFSDWRGLVTWPKCSQTIGHSVTYDVTGGEKWNWTTWIIFHKKTVSDILREAIDVVEGEVQRLWSKELDWSRTWGSRHHENSGMWGREKRESNKRIKWLASKKRKEHMWREMRWHGGEPVSILLQFTDSLTITPPSIHVFPKTTYIKPLL